MRKEKVKWFQKIGGGSFRLRTGKIVKPNERFRALESDVPKAFKDVLIEVEPSAPQQEKPSVAKVPSMKYSLQEPSKGWYNVINENGKPMNEKALRKSAAEDLMAELNLEDENPEETEKGESNE